MTPPERNEAGLAMNSQSYYSVLPMVGRSQSMYQASKRCLDIIGSAIGLFILLPLIVVLVIIIKLDDPKGKVFFKQSRVGKDERTFKIYKFRSMVHNAEERLRQDGQLFEKYVANNYKLDQDEDPRITKVGRFLRKTSLDEIPQLINVLQGDMSLVGPRPVVGVEIEEYGDRKGEFLSVKPGVTGYWQVSGRSNVGYPERVDLELFYVYNQSFWFDIKILLKTVWVVLIKRGAY